MYYIKGKFYFNIAVGELVYLTSTYFNKIP